jgi:hypothetical protein
VPGATLECPAKTGFRHFHVAELLFQIADADMSQGETGLQAKRLLKVLPGVIEPAVFLREPPQIVVAQDAARLELDHLFVNFHRTVDVTQIVVRFGQIGLERDGFPAMGQRFLGAAQVEQILAQIGAALSQPWNRSSSHLGCRHQLTITWMSFPRSEIPACTEPALGTHRLTARVRDPTQTY